MALILKQVKAAPWNALWRKDIYVLLLSVRGAGHCCSATNTYRKLLLDNTDTIKYTVFFFFKQTEAQSWSAFAAFVYEQPMLVIHMVKFCSSALP